MRWISLFLLFIALGLIGAFPALVLAYFFSAGQAAVAGQIYALGAFILASWFPLKALIDSRVKQQPFGSIFPKNISSLAMSFAFVAFLFLIPVLYVNTLSTYLLAILAYNLVGLLGFSSLSFPLALLVACLVQGVSLYQTALREKEFGTANNVFVQFNNIRFNDEMVIDAERHSPRPYQAEMLILPPLAEDYEDEADYSNDYYDEDGSETSSSDSN